jgi:S-DNA-T family DNA segregation ATPase FtsK/SpoIIIE
MRAVNVRIAVVPGSIVIGIELPNPKRETVFLREMMASAAFQAAYAGIYICTKVQIMVKKYRY